MTGAIREHARMIAIRAAQAAYYSGPPKVGVARVKAKRPKRADDPLGKRIQVSDRVIREKNWKAFQRVAKQYAAQVAQA